jgi:hypothetical protein
MFEQLVSVKYLIEHQDHVEGYWYSFAADRHHVVANIESAFPGLIDSTTVATVKAHYEKAKTARSKRLPDVVTMTKDVGLEVFLLNAYYLPLDQSHFRVGGMLSRVVETASGGFAPAPRLAPEVGDESLRVALSMLVRSLELQVAHFRLDGGHLVDDLKQDLVKLSNREQSDA